MFLNNKTKEFTSLLVRESSSSASSIIFPGNMSSSGETGTNETPPSTTWLYNVVVFLCVFFALSCAVISIIWRLRTHPCIKRCGRAAVSLQSSSSSATSLPVLDVKQIRWDDPEKDILPSWYKSRSQGVIVQSENMNVNWTRTLDSHTAARV